VTAPAPVVIVVVPPALNETPEEFKIVYAWYHADAGVDGRVIAIAPVAPITPTS
jgi:hypothetical protein